MTEALESEGLRMILLMKITFLMINSSLGRMGISHFSGVLEYEWRLEFAIYFKISIEDKCKAHLIDTELHVIYSI